LTKDDQGAINFSIIDQGIGIPTEELKEIFSTFVVSSKTRTMAGGRGLGLALCKKVIELHQGNINAESDGVQGARFNITLFASRNN
jgi:signal transduction histidine kinase